MLKLAGRSVAAYAEAATRMEGVRAISELDQQVMTALARDAGICAVRMASDAGWSLATMTWLQRIHSGEIRFVRRNRNDLISRERTSRCR